MPDLTRRSLVAALAVFASAGRAVATSALPTVTITKDPTCGCCSGWAEHVKAAGFPTDVREVADINRVKVRFGIPSNLFACHTAEVDGYVLEGHVPATTI